VSFSVIVHFVDIEEIVDQSLTCLFIITSHLKAQNIYKTNNHWTYILMWCKLQHHISVSAVTFRGYTQSQKIVNQRNKIRGIKKIKMPSQGIQIWLRPDMSSQGNQTWLRSPMSSQGSQAWLR
jgi:hypothetical protein